MAIQKHNDDYNVKHGGKWNLQHVRLFVEATWGREASAKLFDVDSADFWTNRLLSSSSRSQAKEVASKHSHMRILKSG